MLHNIEAEKGTGKCRHWRFPSLWSKYFYIAFKTPHRVPRTKYAPSSCKHAKKRELPLIVVGTMKRFLWCAFKVPVIRVNPISLSYPFPWVVRVHVSVRASSGFDRGVGVRGRGRYPSKPRISASLLWNQAVPEHTDPDHPESIFVLNNWFKITTVLFCALHSPVTCIYICNHALNWNVFLNR